MTMKTLVIGVAAISAVVASIALADDTSLINSMNMKPLTPQESAQLKAERDAAVTQWQKLTPEQRMAIKDGAKTKKQGDLSAIERMGQNDDMMAETKSETADLKAQREAAKAKWDAMTPQEKDAVRKAAQQKRASELSAIEKAGQNDDMNRYFTY
jgi:hypothetical protein